MGKISTNYIYDNPRIEIVAHELGHGAFSLRHTFSPDAFIYGEGKTQNLMDYGGGTDLWHHQWQEIHNPNKLLFGWAQDEEEGEAVLQGSYVKSYIKNIRCLKQKNKMFYYDSSFKYNYGENNYDAWANPILLNDEKYGNIWVWYTCPYSEKVDISSIKIKNGYVYIGKDDECQLKFVVRDKNYVESEPLAHTLIDYLNVSNKTYTSQSNKLLVSISKMSTSKIVDEILNMSECLIDNLSAEWRFYFIEKILGQKDLLSKKDAICINRLLRTVKDEDQASFLIERIKEKEYEKKMINSIKYINSSVFSNIANGLSWLYYSQNENSIIEAGENIEADNLFVWEPYGNAKEKYNSAVENLTTSTYFDWLYNTRTYSYTVHLEKDGRFRIHTVGVEFSHMGPLTYHSDFYISPFETVSVYFASKNKYINIEDHTIVMPGVFLAWLIDQNEREVNQMMIDIGRTVASFSISGVAIIKSAGVASKIFNFILFTKEVTDRLLSSPEVLKFLVKESGDEISVLIERYKELSGIINCGLIFKSFGDKEISSKISLLITAWEEIDAAFKENLKNNKPEIYNYLQEEINKLRN